MTRFARAKGSKASNERAFEEATSWQVMKNQLEQKKKNVEYEEKKKLADKERMLNYQNFLKGKREENESVTTEWASFPDDGMTKAAKKIRKAPKRLNRTGKKKDESKDQAIQNTGKKDFDVDALPERDRRLVLRKLEKKKRQIERKKSKRKQDHISAALPDDVEVSPIDEKKDGATKTAIKIGKPKHKLKPAPARSVKKSARKQSRSENFARKREFHLNKVTINGKEIEIQYYDGFPVKKDDAENLKQLKKELIQKALPMSEIKQTLKLERRKAEKALAREKKNVCFNCRKPGHVLADCPESSSNGELVDASGTGICFKCGSTEHASFACRVVREQSFKFATCFICKEQGHISRQCPDNARGLYPKGGSCRVCGDVTHLKKNCPRFQQQQQMEQAHFKVGTMNHDGNPDEDLNFASNGDNDFERRNLPKYEPIKIRF